jgi:REP element-mobilizing transposase RayT
MKKEKQFTFGSYVDEFKDYWKASNRRVHGGEHAKGKRKTARPFSSQKPIHVVMRATKAKGPMALWTSRNSKSVAAIVKKRAKASDIRIYQFSNNGNHLHILLRSKHKRDFQNFLKTVAGQIAQMMTKARRGAPKGKFWDALTFTRLGDWQRAYENLKDYVLQNLYEAAGVIPYTPRGGKNPRGAIPNGISPTHLSHMESYLTWSYHSLNVEGQRADDSRADASRKENMCA